MHEPKYNNKNNLICMGFDSIEINLVKLFLLLYLGSCIKNVKQNQENLGKKNCLCQNKIQVQKTVGIKN